MVSTTSCGVWSSGTVCNHTDCFGALQHGRTAASLLSSRFRAVLEVVAARIQKTRLCATHQRAAPGPAANYLPYRNSCQQYSGSVASLRARLLRHQRDRTRRYGELPTASPGFSGFWRRSFESAVGPDERTSRGEVQHPQNLRAAENPTIPLLNPLRRRVMRNVGLHLSKRSAPVYATSIALRPYNERYNSRDLWSAAC